MYVRFDNNRQAYWRHKLGYGRKLRSKRKYPNREGYEGEEYFPRSVGVHRKFIVEKLCFNEQLRIDCSNLRDEYRNWLRTEFPGAFRSELENKNNVDLNFLYEEIEIMSGGIAEWSEEGTNNHFIGVTLL